MAGINTKAKTTTKPMNFARTGCSPKKNLQIGIFLFWAAIANSVPTSVPANIVTAILKLLWLAYSNRTSGPPDAWTYSNSMITIRCKDCQ